MDRRNGDRGTFPLIPLLRREATLLSQSEVKMFKVSINSTSPKRSDPEGYEQKILAEWVSINSTSPKRSDGTLF